MGSERRPRERPTKRRSHLELALGTSIRDNSIAFGFSLTVTMSFGLVQAIEGSPSVEEILAFGGARGSPSWWSASRPGRWPQRRPRSCFC